MTKDEIRDLFAKHDLALSQSDVWAVQGTPVVKHSALERLSAKIGITWDMPREVIASMDEVVILARGSRKDGISEWSYGEVKVLKGENGGNYKISGKQAGYPFAMAEKRAKDRVIIKLAGLHGAYSEEEADDFDQRNADGGTSSGARGRSTRNANDDVRDEKPAQDRRDERRDEPDRKPDADPKSEDTKAKGGDEPEGVKKLREAIRKARTTKAVTTLMLDTDNKKLLDSLDEELREDLRSAGKDRLIALGWPDKGGGGSEDAQAA